MIGQGVDITGQSVDITGQSADILGQSADITRQSADILGQPADTAGQSADILGQFADIIGLSADIAGQSADFKMWEERCQSERASGLHWTAFHSTVPGPIAVARVLIVNMLGLPERYSLLLLYSPQAAKK